MKIVLLTLILITAGSVFAAKEINKNTTNMTPPSQTPKEEPTQLDDLIRGELSALNAYDKVLDSTKDTKIKNQLQDIRDNHEKALSLLSKDVADKPELLKDTESSGPWGTFVKIYTKTSTLLGNEAALKALKQGEQHGIKEYEEALKDKTLSAELKKSIKTQFIPAQKEHIKQINKLL